MKSESCVVTQKYSNVSRTVRSRRGQTKIGLCGEQEQIKSVNVNKSWVFLENLKSTIGSPGLNIGRSESGEDSILYVCQSPCEHNVSDSSRYSDLWDRFWTDFHPQSPYETL